MPEVGYRCVGRWASRDHDAQPRRGTPSLGDVSNAFSVSMPPTVSTSCCDILKGSCRSAFVPRTPTHLRSRWRCLTVGAGRGSRPQVQRARLAAPGGGALTCPCVSSAEHSRGGKSGGWSGGDEKRGSSRSEHSTGSSSKSLLPKESRLDTFWD